MINGETITSGAKVDRHVSPFQVMHTGAGYYVGTTWKVCGDPACADRECLKFQELGDKTFEQPNTRETDYMSKEDAECALAQFIAGDGLPGART